MFGHQHTQRIDPLYEINGGGHSAKTVPLLAQPAQDEVVQLTVPPADHDTVEQIRFSLEEMSYTIKVAGGDKTILHNISASFKPGETVALMGASGAGKTTLLRVLAGDVGGKVSGEIKGNGRSLKGTRYQKLSQFVYQEDVLLPSLTPRMELGYLAALKLPQAMSRAEKRERAHRVLEQLNLQGCEDTLVGSVDRKGLSGGQRKRLSIASALLTNPSIVLLDEPTSGLDSKNAEDVVMLLTNLARQGRTVICSVHQPSWNVLTKFDRVLLLHHGRVVFHGPVPCMEPYFERQGVKSPEHVNPIDHIMRVIQEMNPVNTKSPPSAVPEDTKTQKTNRTVTFAERWEEEVHVNIENASPPTGPSQASLCDVGGMVEKEEPEGLFSIKRHAYATPVHTQTLVLLHRAFYDNLCDKRKFVKNCSMKIILALMVGCIWLNQGRPPTNQAIFPLTGAMFLLTNNCVMSTLFTTVMQFPIERTLIQREQRNGAYSLLAAYSAIFISNIVLQFFMSLLLTIPVYFMVGLVLTPYRFFVFLACLALLSFTGCVVGLMVGCAVNDTRDAQQVVLPTIVPLMLFSGYMIPYDSIPIYFKWLYHISFFQYSFAILRINQFVDITFDDCPELSWIPCFHTGVQYLQTPQVDLDPATHPMWFLFAMLAVIMCVFVVCGFFLMRWKIGKKQQ
mmetsp:Transcript_32796/g.81228  ORF Transcript_32796/g.81228 Transcript_32796/m.81228 type:complete len:677 (+) Transcript_32796:126-2156(+)